MVDVRRHFPTKDKNGRVIIEVPDDDYYAKSAAGPKGPTTERLAFTGQTFGFDFYDTDLQELLYWNGDTWDDAVRSGEGYLAPAGFIFLVDFDGSFLLDADGAFLLELL